MRKYNNPLTTQLSDSCMMKLDEFREENVMHRGEAARWIIERFFDESVKTSQKTPVKTSQNGKLTKPKFTPPLTDEVVNQIVFEKGFDNERANIIANNFIDFYASKGWKVGKEMMKDWKAALRRAYGWADRQPNNDQLSKQDQAMINLLNFPK